MRSDDGQVIDSVLDDLGKGTAWGHENDRRDAQGAGRMTLTTSPRLRAATEEAHRRNRIRSYRSLRKVGDSIQAEINRRYQV